MTHCKLERHNSCLADAKQEFIEPILTSSHRSSMMHRRMGR